MHFTSISRQIKGGVQLKRHFALATAVVLLATFTPVAHAQQVGATQSIISADGLLRLVLSSSNPSDTAGVNNTHTWTAINNTTTTTLTGVALGSHWGDWCGGGNCTPPGPTLISAPGCAVQGASEIPLDAHFGVWCTPSAGVTLGPGQSVSGSVTLRPGAGGPLDYTVYAEYDALKIATGFLPAPLITHTSVVTPAATDIQIKGAASTGAPPVGSTFTYTFEIKNAGPWGTYGGITFTDTLPASLTFVSASGSPLGPVCSLQGQTVTCPLGELQNGGTSGQATITLTVIASGPPQQIVNTASALTVLPQTDSNVGNNSATVTVTSQ